MKNESGTKMLKKFVPLRPKTYRSFIDDSNENKKPKVHKSVF